MRPVLICLIANHSSLAKERNLDGLRFPGEDDVYEKPKLDALGL